MSTVNAPPVTYPEQDCKALYDAMKGWGSNQKAIISIIGRRNMQQKQQIMDTYRRMYGKDLIGKLKDELKNHLEKAVVSYMMPPVRRDAVWLYEAMCKEAVVDDRALAGLICARTTQELNAIKAEFQAIYHTSLVQVVKQYTRGDYEQILTRQLNTRRPPETAVDPSLVQHDVQELYRAGAGRIGTNESRFAHIFTERSYTHLRAVFDSYSHSYRRDIEAVIKAEFSGGAEIAYLVIARFTRNMYKFFAYELFRSMKGLGTDDNALIRTVVSRCEWDMAYIKQAFQAEHGKPLDHMIIADTSGEYKHFLLMLIGAE